MLRFFAHFRQLVSIESLRNYWAVGSIGSRRRQRNVSDIGTFTFQQLEPKNLLAGDVTAEFSNGTLTIT